MALLVVVAVARDRDQGPPAPALPGTPLRELAGERRIGTAVRGDVLEGTRAYREIVGTQFSAVTPENEMKWAFVEPERGDVDLEPADRIVRAAGKAGQEVRGHTLVWFFQVPPWVERLKGAELRDAVLGHVQRMVGHYGDGIPVWDVVNEAIADDGQLRDSVFLREMGPGYIEDVFRLVRQLTPKARLYINEIGADGINPKSDKLLEIARDLKGKGLLDGVGLQSHFNLKGIPDGYEENLRRFAELGLEIAITEADVGIGLPATPDKLAHQARVYRRIVRACVTQPACKGITFWGFSDRWSWISETQPGQGAATLLGDDLRPKPAFRAVQRALRG